MTERLHRIEAMRHLPYAMFNCALHLFIIRSRMRGRNRNAAPHTFINQPDIFIILGGKREQPHYTSWPIAPWTCKSTKPGNNARPFACMVCTESFCEKSGGFPKPIPRM